MGFGGEKGLEHVWKNRRSEARAGIADFEDRLAAILGQGQLEPFVAGGFHLASIVEFVRAGVQIVFESLTDQRNVRLSGRLH